MNRVIFACGAIVALLVSLTGCARGSGEHQAPNAAVLARSLRAHGVDCADFRPSYDLFGERELRSLGRCHVGAVTLDINTFRSTYGRDLFEAAHQGICPIARLRVDPVTILPYVRGEWWVVSVPNEVVEKTDESASAWRALAPRVAGALDGTIVNVDCPPLTA